MIPKIIWQTYKTLQPPHTSLESIKSWINQNPDYAWYYFDDTKCKQFIQDHFNDEFYQMYASLPIGVMKSDVWRVAVVYVYGGIYADLDTKCIIPASQWIDKADELVVGVETPHGAINNFIFAAIPKHPAVYSVLETFLDLYNSASFLNKNSPTPVQDFGANAWSCGILKHYGLDNAEAMANGGAYYNTIEKVKEEKTKFFSYESAKFSPNLTHNTAVYHQTGSVTWGGNYDSWRKEQQHYFGVFGH